MKAETEKLIKELHEWGSHHFDDALSKVFNEKIQQILTCETHETKWGKLDIHSYVSKDKQRPTMMGVYHDKGWKVATDGHVLLCVKQSYPEEYEGKIITKYGEVIDGNYPQYRFILPTDTSNWQVHVIDFDAVNNLLKRANAHAKIYGKSKLGISHYVKMGEKWWNVWQLEKFVKAMKADNVDTLLLHPKGTYAYVLTENIEIYMISILEPTDSDYEDESIFVDEL